MLPHVSQGVVFGWCHWDEWKNMSSLKIPLPLNVVHVILGVPGPII